MIKVAQFAFTHPVPGSCAVAYNETILILGGKNEEDYPWGSDFVWPFDPVYGSFQSQAQSWPSMRFKRYFHGCSVIEYEGALSKSLSFCLR